MNAILKEVIVPAKNLWKGTLIFLHGSGDTAVSFKHWIDHEYGEEFSFPNVKIIYPTAPLQPYSLMGGALSNVWFDRSHLSPKAKEILPSIDETASKINDMITRESYQGIESSNIIIGGFSMGASFSLHMAYRHQPNLKGVFVCSSFLNYDSAVYKVLEAPCDRIPPLLMFHGKQDTVVPFQWGQSTFQKLSKSIPNSSFHEYSNLDHSPCKDELIRIKDFVASHLDLN